MKERMTFDEMAEAYVATHPVYSPNRVRVGKFASEMGYKKIRQMVNNKICYFYIKVKS